MALVLPAPRSPRDLRTFPHDHIPVSAPPPLPFIPTGHGPKRPLSPGSLRDVDVPADSTTIQRRRDLPPPPSGHDLMALFPPRPPMDLKDHPTSGYFNAQERAYFSRPGNEIIRWDRRREPRGPSRERGRPPKHRAAPLQGTSPTSSHSHAPPPATVYIPASGHGPLPRSPPMLSAGGPGGPPPYGFSESQAGPSRRQSASSQMTTISIPPAQTPVGGRPPAYHAHGQPPSGPGGPYAPPPGTLHSPPYTHAVPPSHAHGHPPHPAHAPRHSHAHSHPYDTTHRRSRSPKEELDPADPDQGWRRPIPHAERRRAGKHTKRVIVK